MTKTFTLKDIKEAVIEKLKVRGDDYESEAYNQAIDAQSSVRLEFDREGLAETIWTYTRKRELRLNGGKLPKWKDLQPLVKRFYLKIADAIRNAPINSILKVVK